MSILKPLIGVINLSKKLSNADVKTMVIACQEQLKNDVAPNWHMEPWFIIFYEDPKQISLRAYPIVIMDAPDEAGALGYHAERNGRPYGRVFVDPVIQNGGVILYDPFNPQNISLASVLSHEVIELFIDMNANKWADGPYTKHGSSYAYEACDPVQGSSYIRKVGDKNVSLSNFVLPSWFDPQNPTGHPVDFLNIAPGAFQLAPGGYMIVRDSVGMEQQVFAEVRMAKWVQDMKKHSSGRTSRRLTNALNTTKKPWWKYLF